MGKITDNVNNFAISSTSTIYSFSKQIVCNHMTIWPWLSASTASTASTSLAKSLGLASIKLLHNTSFFSFFYNTTSQIHSQSRYWSEMQIQTWAQWLPGKTRVETERQQAETSWGHKIRHKATEIDTRQKQSNLLDWDNTIEKKWQSIIHSLSPHQEIVQTVNKALCTDYPIFIRLSIQHFIYKQLHLCLIEEATISPTFK